MIDPFKPTSVLGRTTCRANHGECVPANVHRLDPDLELCVCKACGQGWVRDVDIWMKLEETMQRLKISTERLQRSVEKMGKSLQAMGDFLNER